MHVYQLRKYSKSWLRDYSPNQVEQIETFIMRRAVRTIERIYYAHKQVRYMTLCHNWDDRDPITLQPILSAPRSALVIVPGKDERRDAFYVEGLLPWLAIHPTHPGTRAPLNKDILLHCVQVGREWIATLSGRSSQVKDRKRRMVKAIKSIEAIVVGLLQAEQIARDKDHVLALCRNIRRNSEIARITIGNEDGGAYVERVTALSGFDLEQFVELCTIMEHTLQSLWDDSDSDPDYVE